jgi:hypothetical protein
MGRTAPTTLAAISALFYYRAADPNNTRAAAVLPGGGLWAAAVATRTRGYERVDFRLTNAGIVTFYVFHGDSAADVNASAPGALVGNTVQDVWVCAAGYAGFAFPVACRDDYIRAYVVGVAGDNLAVGATLDPRQVTHVPFYTTPRISILGGATATVNIPPGSRLWRVLITSQAGVGIPAAPPGAWSYATDTAGARWSEGIRQQFGSGYGPDTEPVPPVLDDGATFPAAIVITPVAAVDNWVWVLWYTI